MKNSIIHNEPISITNQRDDYGNLFDLVPCIITIQGRDYRILKQNGEFVRHFGSKVGEYCFNAYKGRDEKCADCPLEKTFNDGLIHTSEESGIDKDRSVTHWVVRTAPVKDRDGNIIAAMEMSIDVTQRIEAEQQLVQASKLATLGRMASGIAHELNQPLSVIKTSSSFLIKKNNKQEPVKDDIFVTMLTKIDGNVDRASKIINHLREFSRKSDMQTREVQVNDLLEQTCDAFSQQLKIKGINLVQHLDKNIPVIMGDPNRLEQVFINLLINARDAIEEKWGDSKCKPGDKKILFKTMVESEHVVIIVSDTGGGIPDGIADKIFEPFFTTKEVGRGTGLGLSISYGIIKEHGGDIHVVADNKNGAVFIIEIPVKDEGK